ncbi:MAG: hypothetical protein HY939_07670 [Gammaproteobacteria bacterium]|nr:hypothetical protein [Gammaproteobacteria bacterium]
MVERWGVSEAQHGPVAGVVSHRLSDKLLLDRTVNLCNLHEPAVSLNSDDEAVLFDPNAPGLEAYYRRYLSWLEQRPEPNPLFGNDFAVTLASVVAFIVDDQQWSADGLHDEAFIERFINNEKPTHYVEIATVAAGDEGAPAGRIVLAEQRLPNARHLSIPIIPLERFAETKATMPRQLSLLAAFILRRLLDEGVLPRAGIYPHRGTMLDEVEHAWIVFNPTTKPGDLYVVDVMLGAVVNLGSQRGCDLLQPIYGAGNLDACLRRAGKYGNGLFGRAKEKGVWETPPLHRPWTRPRASATEEYAREVGKMVATGLIERMSVLKPAVIYLGDHFNFFRTECGKIYSFLPGFDGMRGQDERVCAFVLLKMQPEPQVRNNSEIDNFFKQIEQATPAANQQTGGPIYLSLRTFCSCFATSRPSASGTGLFEKGRQQSVIAGDVAYEIRGSSGQGTAAVYAAYLLTRYLQLKNMPVQGVFLHRQREVAQGERDVRVTYWLEVLMQTGTQYFVGSGLPNKMNGFLGGGNIDVLSGEQYETKFGLSAFSSKSGVAVTAVAPAAVAAVPIPALVQQQYQVAAPPPPLPLPPLPPVQSVQPPFAVLQQQSAAWPSPPVVQQFAVPPLAQSVQEPFAVSEMRQRVQELERQQRERQQRGGADGYGGFTTNWQPPQSQAGSGSAAAPPSMHQFFQPAPPAPQLDPSRGGSPAYYSWQ